MDLVLPVALAAALALSLNMARAEPRATQLIVVAPHAVAGPRATMRAYERDATGPWREVGAAAPVVGGAKGFAPAWRDMRRTLAAKPGRRRFLKREGDKRTPLGLFTVGRPFGFAPDPRQGYLQLRAGETFCIDDPASPQYGVIVGAGDRRKAGSAEDMGAEPLYRSGFVVDYSANGARRGGSCIFLHIWRKPGAGTAGCVAMSGENMARLQAWLRPGALILITARPEEALSRL
ncbi:MAG: L,D-transpeptidase family protein [Hyphomicrobiales bacterium]|nr:L,D-transpeptidase family protein [Hyphomicrobiales bacterium]